MGKKRIEASLTTGGATGSGTTLAGNPGFFLLLDDTVFMRTILFWRFSSAVEKGEAWNGWKWRMIGMVGLTGMPGGLG